MFILIFSFTLLGMIMGWILRDPILDQVDRYFADGVVTSATPRAEDRPEATAMPVTRKAAAPKAEAPMSEVQFMLATPMPGILVWTMLITLFIVYVATYP